MSAAKPNPDINYDQWKSNVVIGLKKMCHNIPWETECPTCRACDLIEWQAERIKFLEGQIATSTKRG